MAAHQFKHSRSSDKNSHIWTKLASLGVASLLGLSYYRKISTVTNNKHNNKHSDELDIDHCFKVALSASYDAGKLIKKYINDTQTKNQSILCKSSVADFATQIDKDCEALILKQIRFHFPNHKIVAEESCSNPNGPWNLTNEPTWFVDPIDGTTNFVHGIPMTCVSIGLRYHGKSVMGVVHCPLLGQTFHGIVNRGSYCIYHNDNNKQVKLQSNTMQFDNKESMKKALVLTEVGYDRSEKWCDALCRRLHDLLNKESVRGIRCLGSCAINMCYVASGRADIYFEGTDNKSGPKPWDNSAAQIIVEEAGGYVCLPEGKPFDTTAGRLLVCNNKTTAEYLTKIPLYKNSEFSEF